MGTSFSSERNSIEQTKRRCDAILLEAEVQEQLMAAKKKQTERKMLQRSCSDEDLQRWRRQTNSLKRQRQHIARLEVAQHTLLATTNDIDSTVAMAGTTRAMRKSARLQMQAMQQVRSSPRDAIAIARVRDKARSTAEEHAAMFDDVFDDNNDSGEEFDAEETVREAWTQKVITQAPPVPTGQMALSSENV